MVRSPIKWSGGKSRLRKFIVSAFPKHDCYVEVFGGAGWVLFEKEPSKVEVFNDINQELTNFFSVVRNQPQKLIESFRWELVERAKFESLQSMPDQNIADLTSVERAHRFFYIIMAAWGGEYGSARFQTSVKDGGKGNRLIGALQNLEKRITPAHQRLQKVIIENLSWQECISRYDKKGKADILMYLDPPYPDNNVNYAHNMRSWAEHEELARVCRSMNAKFVLSSYDTREMRELFPSRKYDIMPVQFASGMPTTNGTTKPNQEILITNFALESVEKRGELI